MVGGGVRLSRWRLPYLGYHPRDPTPHVGLDIGWAMSTDDIMVLSKKETVEWFRYIQAYGAFDAVA